MNPVPLKKLLVAFLAVPLASLPASAATVGLDNASAAAYGDGWQDTDDGTITGDAFIPWGLTTSGVDLSNFAGHFIGNSVTLASPGADITSGGNNAFGMFASGTASANAFRTFNGGGLSIGQTASIDLALNFRNGSKGINLREGGTEIFNFNIGGDDYVVNNAATGNGSIGNTYSDETAFNLSFTQTSAAGGDWTIARSGGVTDSDSGTYLGTPDNFQLYISGTGGGPSNDFYSNNPQIIPEPSAAFLVALTGLLAAARRRRRS